MLWYSGLAIPVQHRRARWNSGDASKYVGLFNYLLHSTVYIFLFRLILQFNYIIVIFLSLPIKKNGHSNSGSIRNVHFIEDCKTTCYYDSFQRMSCRNFQIFFQGSQTKRQCWIGWIDPRMKPNWIWRYSFHINSAMFYLNNLSFFVVFFCTHF